MTGQSKVGSYNNKYSKALYDHQVVPPCNVLYFNIQLSMKYYSIVIPDHFQYFSVLFNRKLCHTNDFKGILTLHRSNKSPGHFLLTFFVV